MSTSPNPPRTAVFGLGTIGQALAEAHARLDPDSPAVARTGTRFTLDLAASRFELPPLPEMGVRHALLAGGVTGLAACEADPAGARRVNVDGMLRLAERLADMGITVVWFSTDYVFDGLAREYADEAPASPLNEYGRQKAEVEARLPLVCAGNCLILRLGKVYSTTPGDGSLLDEMAGLLAGGRPVRAARDQVFAMAHLSDVTGVVLALQARQARGLYNLCAPEAVSRLEVAQSMATAMGAPAGLVLPISLDDLNESFRRPKRVVLRGARLERECPHAFIPLAESVRRLAGAYAAKPAHG